MIPSIHLLKRCICSKSILYNDDANTMVGVLDRAFILGTYIMDGVLGMIAHCTSNANTKGC